MSRPGRTRNEARRIVAREAALLLYRKLLDEYRQAKEAAAEALGARTLPSNQEVATELDRLAWEMEGEARRQRIIHLRGEALKLMLSLQRFSPRLIGSVWRGTAHRFSDIDIIAYADKPGEVIEAIESLGLSIKSKEWEKFQAFEGPETSLHIHAVTNSGSELEVIVRHTDEMGLLEKCDIYGDCKAGIDAPRLAKVLREDPERRFTPKTIQANDVSFYYTCV